MYNPMPIELTKTYAAGSKFPYALGQEVPLGDKVFKFVKYNDGDGNIPGLRGRTSYRVVLNSVAEISTKENVTCDLSSTTVVASAEFAGIIQPDIVLHNEGCWVQIIGPGEVPMWATIGGSDPGIDRSAYPWLMPAAAAGGNITGDGIVAIAALSSEQRIFAELLADVEGTPTAATDRVLLAIDAGQTTTAQFIVGETVTGGTSADTAVVVERLRRGSSDYGLICSTATATYFNTAAETLTGGTSAAAGSLSCKGVIIPAINYRLIRK